MTGLRIILTLFWLALPYLNTSMEQTAEADHACCSSEQENNTTSDTCCMIMDCLHCNNCCYLIQEVAYSNYDGVSIFEEENTCFRDRHLVVFDIIDNVFKPPQVV